MQATLLNFGHCTRIIRDASDKSLSIDIGQVVEADIHDAHYSMIKKSIKTDTLMVIPNECAMTDRLSAVIDVLKASDEDGYNAALQRFHSVVPHDNEEPDFRPNRSTMLRKLCDTARFEVMQMLHMNKVNIREEGDEVTRQPVPSEDNHGDGMLREIVEPGREPGVPPIREPGAEPGASADGKNRAKTKAK